MVSSNVESDRVRMFFATGLVLSAPGTECTEGVNADRGPGIP
jgi:hypothetical protein